MHKILSSKPYLITEFFTLCIAVPGYIIITKSAPFLFSFLWGATLYGYLILRGAQYSQTLRTLWNWEQVNWTNLKPILIRWLLASIGMCIFIYFYDPDQLFRLAKEHPQRLSAIILIYPVLSALPQEFIFCSFFFARYAPFFGSGKKMVIASAIIFAYAHILYINPVAPTLSLLGGLIFAQTYLKTKSLSLVTIEHGLYGISLFISGTGWYFYSGNVS